MAAGGLVAGGGVEADVSSGDGLGWDGGLAGETLAGETLANATPDPLPPARAPVGSARPPWTEVNANATTRTATSSIDAIAVGDRDDGVDRALWLLRGEAPGPTKSGHSRYAASRQTSRCWSSPTARGDVPAPQRLARSARARSVRAPFAQRSNGQTFSAGGSVRPGSDRSRADSTTGPPVRSSERCPSRRRRGV